MLVGSSQRGQEVKSMTHHQQYECWQPAKTHDGVCMSHTSQKGAMLQTSIGSPIATAAAWPGLCFKIKKKGSAHRSYDDGLCTVVHRQPHERLTSRT